MIELVLNDMTCGHCVKTVTRTVQQIDPDAKVEIDLAHHRVQIDSTREPQAFRQALADEGYPAAD